METSRGGRGIAGLAKLPERALPGHRRLPDCSLQSQAVKPVLALKTLDDQFSGNLALRTAVHWLEPLQELQVQPIKPHRYLRLRRHRCICDAGDT